MRKKLIETTLGSLDRLCMHIVQPASEAPRSSDVCMKELGSSDGLIPTDDVDGISVLLKVRLLQNIEYGMGCYSTSS